jgi:hypothetical protein
MKPKTASLAAATEGLSLAPSEEGHSETCKKLRVGNLNNDLVRFY